MLGLTIVDFIMAILGILSLIAWLYVYTRSLKYASLFEPLNEEEFRLKELYCMGYAVLEMMHYQYKSKKDRKLRTQLDVLYGEKYADYYLRVVHSQQITFAMIIVVVAFIYYGLSRELVATVVMLAMAGVAYYYFGVLTERKILARSDELLHDFSEVVSKLALLTNAGMILREAWEEVAYADDSVIYKEMQKSIEEMNNGVADVDAIYNFGSRCMLPEIKKFTSTIIQGITKGNNELSMMLQQQSKEVWSLKKQIVRRDAEKAADKLLLPLCVMFIGIIIMIIVPIFSNIGV